jgi:hypothetical protein
MTETCEWCGGPRRPQQQTCSAPCRAGRWRWLTGVTRAGGAPPEAPPWPGSPLHGRMGEKGRANTSPAPSMPAPGPRSGVKARSGTMISFWKAVRAARGAVREPALADAVEKALTDALAPAQRRKLEADRGR